MQGRLHTLVRTIQMCSMDTRDLKKLILEDIIYS